MHINPKNKIHKVVNENIIMLHSDKNEMSKVISFNSTSLWLWEELSDTDFETEDVVKLLCNHYYIDEATAQKDATKWVKILEENGLLL